MARALGFEKPPSLLETPIKEKLS